MDSGILGLRGLLQMFCVCVCVCVCVVVCLAPCTPGEPVSHFPFPPAPFWMVLEIISGYYQPLVQRACLYLAPRKTTIVTLAPAAHIPPSWLQTVGCHSSECTSPALASPHGSPSAAGALLSVLSLGYHSPPSSSLPVGLGLTGSFVLSPFPVPRPPTLSPALAAATHAVLIVLSNISCYSCSGSFLQECAV